MRVALDTNILVSAFATRGLCADVLNLVLAEHVLVVGKTVLVELRRVLAEKIRVPAKTLDEVEALLRQEGVIVGNTTPLKVEIRDSADVPVLSEAVAGKAEVLITGDRDLLSITVQLPVKIITPREFWDRLRGIAPP